MFDDFDSPFPRHLTDASGLYLGSERTGALGQRQLRDAQGLFRGTYDPSINLTRDAQGLLVGRGNLLTALLPSR